MADPESINGLGSRDSVIQAVADAEKRGLSSDERALVMAIGSGARLGTVLERAGLPESKAIALLLGLRLRGVVHPAASRSGPVFDAGIDGSVPLTPPTQSRSFTSVGAPKPAPGVPPPRPGSAPRSPLGPSRPEAEARPIDLAALNERVDLDDARKREVLELEARLDSSDHFSLLGVSRSADPATAKKAYYELTKRFHPDRFFGKSLGSYKGRIERIFKRLTEAQAVLCDPAARKAYLAAHPAGSAAAAAAPSQPRPADPMAAERAAERRSRLARHPYLAKRAKFNELVARGKSALSAGQFDRALGDFNLATQIEPHDTSVVQLISEAKKGGDRTRAEAEFNEGRSSEQMGDWTVAFTHLRRAVQLAPDNAHYAHYLARLLAAQDSPEALKEAHGHARRASELEPGNADYHSTSGGILLRAGLEKNALREYEQVLRLRPEDAYARDLVRKLRLKTKLF